MSSVAERLDTMLGEYGRFTQGRAATGPAWLRELRGRGASRFAAVGFPTVRQEEWRFTNVAPIADTPFRLADKAPTNAAELAARVQIPEAAARVVILNGHFAPELSNLAVTNGLVAGSLAKAIADNRPECAHLSHQTIERVAFAALNTAFLDDGAFVVIPANVVLPDPIHIVVINGGAGRTMAHPRTLIVAGANSQARIAQTFLGAAGEAHFTNAVTEVSLGENANLDLYTDQRETDTASHVPLARCATCQSRSITVGGRRLRNDIFAVLSGEGAHCALDGCYLVDGDRLVDNHTTIDHATTHCTSHELYKGILDGKARAV